MIAKSHSKKLAGLAVTMAVTASIILIPATANAFKFEILPAEKTKLCKIENPDPQLCLKFLFTSNPATLDCLRGGNLLLGTDGTPICWTGDRVAIPKSRDKTKYSEKQIEMISACLVEKKSASFMDGKLACMMTPKAVMAMLPAR